MKICEVDGCTNNQFGGGKCTYHQYLRRMYSGDLYKPKTRKSPIPKESKKRKVEHKRYLDEIKEFRQESIDNGTYICFFCNIKDDKLLCNHHLRKRTGNYYLDRDYFVWSHNDCHNKYHFGTVEELMRESWLEDWLRRLEIKDSQSHKKEQNRIKKALNNLDI